MTRVGQSFSCPGHAILPAELLQLAPDPPGSPGPLCTCPVAVPTLPSCHQLTLTVATTFLVSSWFVTPGEFFFSVCKLGLCILNFVIYFSTTYSYEVKPFEITIFHDPN